MISSCLHDCISLYSKQCSNSETSGLLGIYQIGKSDMTRVITMESSKNGRITLSHINLSGYVGRMRQYLGDCLLLHAVL